MACILSCEHTPVGFLGKKLVVIPTPDGESTIVGIVKWRIFEENALLNIKWQNTVDERVHHQTIELNEDEKATPFGIHFEVR